jgi:hypothetical protein
MTRPDHAREVEALDVEGLQVPGMVETITAGVALVVDQAVAGMRFDRERQSVAILIHRSAAKTSRVADDQAK